MLFMSLLVNIGLGLLRFYLPAPLQCCYAYAATIQGGQQLWNTSSVLQPTVANGGTAASVHLPLTGNVYPLGHYYVTL